MKRNLRVEVEGRRWRREGSCRLKHLKAKRGLTLPFGSSGDDLDLRIMMVMVTRKTNGYVEMCSSSET